MDETNQPPRLQKSADGSVTTESLADVIEWFLNFDERVAAIRHPHTEALFQWKQEDLRSFGEEVYPFPRAEDRMAIGVFQALGEHATEDALHGWVTDLLAALQQARETHAEVAADYKFSADTPAAPLAAAEMISSTVTQRLYLTACWLETLCTAEARILGWVYQDLYGKPFAA